ncbi:MAG TPA: hypothetical protein DE045_06875 [Oceanospirillaceae bacterium]|nr:hypothetical protein [Oceanospirillaceae bacterium]
MIRVLPYRKQLDVILKLQHFDTVRVFPMLVASLVIGACSTNPLTSSSEDSILRDKSLDYAQSKVIARLTVPADLDATAIQQDLLRVPSQTAVTATGVVAAPRPDFVFAQTGSASARLIDNGQQKRISVVGNVAKVKQQVVQFWANQQIPIILHQVGSNEIVETQWFSLSDDAVADDFISRWVRSLTDADDELAHGRVRIELVPQGQDRVELVLSFLQHSQLQITQQQELNWGAAGQSLANESELTFELLRYLSRTAQVAQKTQSSTGHKDLVLLGKDQFGEPVIQLDMGSEESLNMVLQAMSDFDVGSHDLNPQKIYFTYTSHVKSVVQQPSSSDGIWGWFKGLHGGERKQGISLDLALLGGDEEAANTSAAPVYSSNPDQADPVTDLADKKGYKIWLAGEVIYVFEDEDQGDVNEQGEYTYVAQYQLNFETTLKSTYLQVLNSQGEAAPTVYAKEILWKIQQGLDSLQ